MLLEEDQFEQARVDSENALNILVGCGAKRDAHRAENLLTQLK
jgi:hypothetical protein